MMATRRTSYQIRPPPKEVFPESTLSPGGLQLTTLFWDAGIMFHQGSHAGARVGNNFEVFVCIATHVSSKSNVPPHPSYWRRIPSPGGSFSLSTSPAFTSAAFQGGPHRVQHGRHHSSPRHPSSSSHPPLSRHMAGALNDCFSSSGRHGATSHVVSTTTTTTTKTDSENHLLASSTGHGSGETAGGLGPVQNQTLNSAAAPGSSFNRQTAAGYCPGTGPHPTGSSASMGNSNSAAAPAAPAAPMTHSNHHHHHQHNNHVRISQFENVTTQSTGHDRTGVGGGRNGNVDAAAGDMMYASYGGGGRTTLPAEHHPHLLGLTTEVVGLS